MGATCSTASVYLVHETRLKQPKKNLKNEGSENSEMKVNMSEPTD